jgi:hypothetical protein
MSHTRGPVTDSPWFWAYLFATAGLIALALAGPKYRLRQAQIERQFEGRQPGAVHSVEEKSDPASTAEETHITLRPLFLGLVAVTIVAWFVFWRTYVARREAPP